VPTRRTLGVRPAGRFARLALDCVHREYPNHPLTLLTGEDDVRPPRDHTPAFFGCFDWHSAVHGHWTLVRLIRLFPREPWSDDARAALRRSLTAANLAGEVRHLSKPGREGFERPYGLAWLLLLAAELHRWKREEEAAQTFAEAVEPLAQLCFERLANWLPKLRHPIRSGEHSQTAFAMGLVWDWATSSRRAPGGTAQLLAERATAFYGNDRELPLRFEPSGHDFLSPALAEADLMRRVMTPERFADWLGGALPDLAAGAFSPASSGDPADGKLAHLDGLNLSRAWMLDGIVARLPEGDGRVATLRAIADSHAEAGLAAVTGEHYAGGHWLGTFATYLMTSRGLEE